MKIIKSTISSDPVIVLQIRDGERTGFVIENNLRDSHQLCIHSWWRIEVFKEIFPLEKYNENNEIP